MGDRPRAVLGTPPQKISAAKILSGRRLTALLADAFTEVSSGEGARLAAALAYYTLFSIAPLLIVILAITSLALGGEAARSEILPRIRSLVGSDAAQAIELSLAGDANVGKGIIAVITGLVGLFLGASVVIDELRQSLNIMWKLTSPAAPSRGLIESLRRVLFERFYAFAVVVGAGVLLFLSILINTVVAAIGAYFAGWLPVPETALHLISFATDFLTSALVFTAIYRTVPDALVSWRDAALGAIITAVLFDFGSVIAALCIGKIATISASGMAGAFLALLVWLYWASRIFFFGAEITRLIAVRYGDGIEVRYHTLRGIVDGGGWIAGPHAKA